MSPRSSDDLRRLAASAASWTERLAQAPARCDPSEEAELLLERWAEVLGGELPLQRRLAAMGQDRDRASSLLSAQVCEAPLSPWVRALDELLADAATHARARRPTEAHRCTSARSPVPFEQVLVPVVLAASARLLARVRVDASEAVWAAVERRLLWRLSTLCTPTLEREFTLVRHLSSSPLERLLSPPDSRDVYEQFVAELWADELWGLLETAPALGRALVRVVERWLDTFAELLVRLDADALELERCFSGIRAPRGVTGLFADLSDPHAGGRTVCILRFARGRGLVYKPRDLRLEHAWSELLAWLAKRGAPIELWAPAMLLREGYGWVEEVEARPCTDIEGFARFYTRAGALMCLVHLLAGGDLHRENLVAYGDMPVLIDLETLLHPHGAPPDQPGETARRRLNRRLAHCVLATGLLPRWTQTARGGYEGAGLGPGGALRTTVKVPTLTNPNTDQQAFRLQDLTLPRLTNVPRTKELTADPGSHVRELVEGFTITARFLLSVREALLAPDGPLQRFVGLRTRVLLRNTEFYGLVLDRMRRAFDHGAHPDIELDVLTRSLSDDAGEGMRRLVEAEQRALADFDIPCFHALTDDVRCLETGDSLAPNDREGVISGLQLARERLGQLDEGWIAEQVRLIRLSFQAWAAAPGSDDGARRRRVRVPALEVGEESIDLLDEARRLAEVVLADAVHGDDGSSNWIAPQLVPHGGPFRLGPMGPDLYTGLSGVGLFLVAAGVVLDDRRFADAGRACLGQLASAFRHDVSPVPLGGVMGLGSAIWSLAWTGSLLGADELIAAAHRAAALVDDKSLAADHHDDLAGGAAGAILGLLALHGLSPDPALLERARACAERLLNRSTGSPRCWPNADGIQLAGLAHGASGIAHALLSLYVHDRDHRWLAAAREGVAAEDTLFDPDPGNWRDQRPDVPGPGPAYMIAWCNGAAGIALARVHWAEAGWLDPRMVDAAIETTLACPLGVLDHLCCGNLGRIETLFEVGLARRRDDLVGIARRRATAIVARARALGGASGYGLVGDRECGAQHAAFFRGISGIGYGLLRLSAPGRLPCALSLAGLSDGRLCSPSRACAWVPRAR